MNVDTPAHSVGIRWPWSKRPGRIDTLARVATALDRHLVLSFPTEVSDTLTDAVHVS